MHSSVRILAAAVCISILVACGGTSGGSTGDAGTDAGADAGTDGGTCTAGVACTPATANACQTFETACAGNVVSCVAAGNVPDGTSCGTGQFCSTGACVTSTTRTVSSTLRTVYVRDDGTRVVKPGWDTDVSFGATVTGLLIPDSSQPSGYKTVAVTVGADSSFSVPDVPFGPYFIQVDLGGARTTSVRQSDPAVTLVSVVDRVLFESGTNTPDLSLVLAKRADAPSETFDSSDPQVLLDFSGLAPIATLDTFRFFSTQSLLNASFSRGSLRPAPDAGSTQTSSNIFWDSKAFGNRPDSSKGDVEWIFQRRTQTIDGGISDTEVETFARVSDFTFVDGGVNTITATFAAPPQTGVMPAEMHLSAFGALAAAVHPGATGSSDPSNLPFLGIDGVPHAIAFPNQPIGAIPGPPLLLDFQFDTSLFVDQAPTFAQVKSLAFPSASTDVTLASPVYPQLFDSTWKELAQVFYAYDVPLKFSAADSFTVTGGAFYRSFTPPAQLTSPVVPQLGPPTAPLLNGTDAFAFQTGAGTQPVISWSAPALGTASKYLLTVERADNAFNTNDLESVTVVLYDKTSFKLPAGLLVTGKQYVGVITAMSSPDRLNDPILGLGSPRVEVNAVFGVFQP